MFQFTSLSLSLLNYKMGTKISTAGVGVMSFTQDRAGTSVLVQWKLIFFCPSSSSPCRKPSRILCYGTSCFLVWILQCPHSRLLGLSVLRALSAVPGPHVLAPECSLLPPY